MIKKSIITAVAVIAAAQSHAAILFDYTFTGGSAAATNINSSVTNVSDWGFTVDGSNFGTSSISDNTFGRANATPSSDGGVSAPSGDAFFSFSFEVNVGAGNVLDLTSISATYFSTGLEVSDVFTVSLYSDITGYAGTSDALDSSTISGSESNAFSADLTSSNLIAGSDYTGLTNGTIVEFRYYLSDNSAQNSEIHRLDNVTINGTVSAVPEAADYGLIASALAIASVFILRRKA